MINHTIIVTHVINVNQAKLNQAVTAVQADKHGTVQLVLLRVKTVHQVVKHLVSISAAQIVLVNHAVQGKK